MGSRCGEELFTAVPVLVTAWLEVEAEGRRGGVSRTNSLPPSATTMRVGGFRGCDDVRWSDLRLAVRSEGPPKPRLCREPEGADCMSMSQVAAGRGVGEPCASHADKSSV